MFAKNVIHIGVIVQDIRHFYINFTDLFELVVHTGEPALVTGICKVTFIDDLILAGLQPTNPLFGQNDINNMHDFT